MLVALWLHQKLAYTPSEAHCLQSVAQIEVVMNPNLHSASPFTAVLVRPIQSSPLAAATALPVLFSFCH